MEIENFKGKVNGNWKGGISPFGEAIKNLGIDKEIATKTPIIKNLINRELSEKSLDKKNKTQDSEEISL